jgi:hypothetical protein
MEQVDGVWECPVEGRNVGCGGPYVEYTCSWLHGHGFLIRNRFRSKTCTVRFRSPALRGCEVWVWDLQEKQQGCNM